MTITPASLPKSFDAAARMADDWLRAEQLIGTACLLAGSVSFLDDIETEIRAAGLDIAIRAHNTGPIYNWLVDKLSYQGISDQVARTYLRRHGNVTWSQQQRTFGRRSSCPKLRNYWHYEGCRYDKTSGTCAEPEHIHSCPVPRPRLRNGRLNQTAVSLFLFLRDITNADVVSWIDGQLDNAEQSAPSNPHSARQEAVIGPLRHVYGIADKMLTMTLSTLMLGVGRERPLWFETGAAMITVDTLVHNFLHRTGILQACGVRHEFGSACYRTGGCAEIVRQIAGRIDARKINPAFPSTFPRFVQHAIWRYCAADGMNVCNGVKIDDRRGCRDAFCRLGLKCRRIPLKAIKTQ